jgi:hypothetical protein
VIDAFGAIYVIGGITGRDDTYLNDVWASTNGGARADLVGRGMVGEYSRGCSRGYSQGY